MEKPGLKVATPLTVLAVRTPVTEPPAGAVATARVMVVGATGMTLPNWSSTPTVSGGERGVPSQFADGSETKPIITGAPGVTVKAEDVAEVRPGSVAFNICEPAASGMRLVKVATPFTAATVKVPANAPPLPSARVTLLSLVVTRFPN